jgi:hypothetical protein
MLVEWEVLYYRIYYITRPIIFQIANHNWGGGLLFSLPCCAAVNIGQGVGSPQAHRSVGYSVSLELFRLKVKCGINISEWIFNIVITVPVYVQYQSVQPPLPIGILLSIPPWDARNQTFHGVTLRLQEQFSKK